MIAKARAAAAVGSNGDLVFDMNARAALHLPVDDHAGRVDEDEARAELGTAPDNAALRDHVELVEGPLQRRETVSAGPLHRAIQQHRRRTVGHEDFQQGERSVVLVTPGRLGTEVACSA